MANIKITKNIPRRSWLSIAHKNSFAISLIISQTMLNFAETGPCMALALFTFCDVWSKSDLNGIRDHILLFLTQRLQSLLDQWLQRQFRLWMVREPFFVQFHTRHAFSSVISNIWTFEDSFESTQWRKAKQMQPLVHPFEQHSRLTCPEEGGEGDGRPEEKDEWGKNSPHIFPASFNICIFAYPHIFPASFHGSVPFNISVPFQILNKYWRKNTKHFQNSEWETVDSSSVVQNQCRDWHSLWWDNEINSWWNHICQTNCPPINPYHPPIWRDKNSH